jgi:hypothetical protein
VDFASQGPPPTAPAFTGTSRPAANQVRLEWVGAAELLSSTNIVAGPWTPVANAATPYTTPPAGDLKFYRLKQ